MMVMVVVAVRPAMEAMLMGPSAAKHHFRLGHHQGHLVPKLEKLQAGHLSLLLGFRWSSCCRSLSYSRSTGCCCSRSRFYLHGRR